MMKPKGKDEHDEGLLEYLEDLIGSDVFKQPIADALTDLERLNEARQVFFSKFFFDDVFLIFF